MDRLFFDTNILLDILAKRVSFWGDALEVLYLAKSRTVHSATTALSLSDIFYVMRKEHSQRTRIFFRELRSFMEITPIGGKEVDRALENLLPDFEDCLQWEAACHWNATHLITRNGKDFPFSTKIAVMDAATYLKGIR
jgi:predicted nucleic acid-binding protein